MKRYTEYTKEELAELSEDQIQTLIDLEIAYQGVLPVFPPVLPEITPISISKTVTAYHVGPVYFLDIEQAKQFMALEVYDSKYNYQGAGYDYKYLSKAKLEMIAEAFYEKNDITAMEEAIMENNRLTKIAEKERETYNKFVNITRNVRDDVRTAVEEAWEYKRTLEKAKAMQQKYLALADNDEAIAEKFFRDAYKNNEEIIQAVYPSDVENKETVTI